MTLTVPGRPPKVDRRRAQRRKALPPLLEIPDGEVAASLLEADDAPTQDGRLEGAVDDWPGIDDAGDAGPDEPAGESRG